MSDFQVSPPELKELGKRFQVFDLVGAAQPPIEVAPEPVEDKTRDILGTIQERAQVLHKEVAQTIIALGDGLESTAKAYKIADGWPE